MLFRARDLERDSLPYIVQHLKSITAPQTVRYVVIDPAFGGIYDLHVAFIPTQETGMNASR